MLARQIAGIYGLQKRCLMFPETAMNKDGMIGIASSSSGTVRLSTGVPAE